MFNWIPQMPFTDNHQLDLDFILSKYKQLEDDEATIQASLEGAEAAKEGAEAAATNAANSAAAALSSAANAEQSALAAASAVAYVTPQMYGAVGDGVTDDTAAFNRACAASKFVYVPDGVYLINSDNAGWGYITEGGIFPQSNSRFIMSNNAILKAKANNTGFYNILNLNHVEKVTVCGGKIKGEKNEHVGTSGEFGYGIRIGESNNIAICNVDISECWGDGIITTSDNETTGDNNNIVIENCVIHDCRRQGISIVIGTDVTIKDCEIYNITGKLPQSGIDIEPNATTVIENVTILNCQIYDVAGSGVIVNDHTIGTSINGGNIKSLYLVNGENITISGCSTEQITVEAKKVFVDNCNIQRIEIEGGSVQFDNCYISGTEQVTLIMVGVQKIATSQSEYIKFNNCIIETNENNTYCFQLISSGGVDVLTEHMIGLYNCNITVLNTFMSRTPHHQLDIIGCNITMPQRYQIFTVNNKAHDFLFKFIGNTLVTPTKSNYFLAIDFSNKIEAIISNNKLNYQRLIYCATGATGACLVSNNVLDAQFPDGIAGGNTGITVTTANNVL